MTRRHKRPGNVSGALLFLVAGAALLLWLWPAMRRISTKNGEAGVRLQLIAVRSALQTYYRDTQGAYPADPRSLAADGRYLKGGKFPEVWALNFHDSPGGLRKPAVPHAKTSRVAVYGAYEARDTGGWAYVFNPGSVDHGTFFIDCTHRDTRGVPWSAY